MGEIMTLELLVNLAEIVGSLVIAASLVFVVVQLRQNTLAVEQTANQRLFQQVIDINNMPIVCF
jgi:hypothetical protein